MARPILAACLVLATALGGVAVVQADRLLVPGERAGPIGGDISEDDLFVLAPREQIRRDVRSVGESFYACGTVMFAGTPDEIFLRWDSPLDEVDMPDPETFAAACASHPPLRRLFSVSVEPTGNIPPAWAIAEGLRVGMTLAEAEAALGRALEISVCGCDHGGTIAFAGGGMLDNLRLRSGYPPDVETALAGKVNADQDYSLLVSDIPEAMMQSFLIDRIEIEFP